MHYADLTSPEKGPAPLALRSRRSRREADEADAKRRVCDATAERRIARVTICTAITKSHLAYARTLARSMLSIHPAAQVYVLLADRNDGDFDPAAEPFHLIPL